MFRPHPFERFQPITIIIPLAVFAVAVLPCTNGRAAPPGTTSGGTTWISQASGTDNFLEAVSVTAANTGTEVGWQGTILLTQSKKVILLK